MMNLEEEKKTSVILLTTGPDVKLGEPHLVVREIVPPLFGILALRRVDHVSGGEHASEHQRRRPRQRAANAHLAAHSHNHNSQPAPSNTRQ